ncbi:predicted protein [Botrytis cinerea T4]|uniref:Uncharacterized protein n=1 Tax=Botryotinia fuckeliana (strain T4) TaxID=999810 RepID=G2YL06_BOTF4|nr:predicted protein [Botrytis cinerea T4]
MSDDLELKSHLSEIPIPIKTQVGRVVDIFGYTFIPSSFIPLRTPNTDVGK